MIVEAQVTINAPKAAIWNVITDIENASKNISGIEEIEVLEKPESGLVGLAWRETRTIFGKTATEDMRITDAAEDEFYRTRAESHGCIYISSLSISGDEESSTLTMNHVSEPQSFLAKLMSLPMNLMFKRMMRKEIQKDLNDIKGAVEGR